MKNLKLVFILYVVVSFSLILFSIVYGRFTLLKLLGTIFLGLIIECADFVIGKIKVRINFTFTPIIKKVLLCLIVVLFFVILFILNNYYNYNNEKTAKKGLLTGKHYVEMVVKDYGVIDLELDADVAPITVTNFINLVKDKFYDGLTFHRIIDGFMVQGGQNKEKDAKTILGEFKSNGVNNNISHVRGVISMARVDGMPNSASSQFFIVQEDATYLDGNYASFGKVIRGMDVVDNLAKVEVIDNNGTVEEDKQPIIESIKVIDKDKLKWTEDE